ncbi:Peroxisomal membrane PEX29-like protein [Cladobotryum mycophilum]|uniref:Peroxisomal membrane PEX29-like protein n=1 Tax=Cladobotryum mycophilum TaxID=491253 RepID=A0ABR0SJS3_9HYPO
MDDFAAEMLASSQREPSRHRSPERNNNNNNQKGPAELDPSTTTTAQRPGGLRSGLAALREKANIQDRLVEKLLEQVIPINDGFGPDASGEADDAPSAYDQRPNFTLATMSNNFRRFNARIGVVFKFQDKVVHLLMWRRPTHTLSLLAAYTFICLDPYLLSVLPIVILVLGAFIPGFLARHPAPPKGTLSSEQMGYSPRGPPLAPAATVRPVKELSKDFFRNMRDLQNCMDDFSQGHDQVVAVLVPLSNFSDEALSSAIFLFLIVGGVVMTITAHILPWRFIFLFGGWGAIGSGHPVVVRLLAATRQEHMQPQDLEARAKTWMDGWIADDVILDSAPETREVEVFELQRDSGTGEWEPWVFCPSPYDPLSQARIAGERPRGTRFFEDVMPPEGWEWSEKKWALDLWSRDWVEERIITGVEVETEGERWVYDIYNEREDRTGVVDHERAKVKAPVMPQTSWEEGEDGNVQHVGVMMRSFL